ncbi:hypothetical protein, partial [Streptomyces sp. NPDC006552]|uniref:hypothetical protein n=1 Tax=Streptomyces sp. NPDC006552 TaxID=3157179 RepID=UPI0033B042F2
AVEVKATYKGAVADGVAATATLVKAADDPAEVGSFEEGRLFGPGCPRPVRSRDCCCPARSTPDPTHRR